MVLIRDVEDRKESKDTHESRPAKKTLDITEKSVYQPEDLFDLDYDKDLGDPGHFPFTRGIYPKMHAEKLWTMRQFSGYGTPEETNKRFKFLFQHGQNGLSVAFDLPTLMGLDSDNPLSEGEVGKCGVAVDSLQDMELLFEDIPLNQVTTSMTINAPAAIFLAMYVVVAKKQGVDLSRIGGTVQNDILKEFIAQKEWIYPPDSSMRLVTDSIQFCTNQLPRYNSISISGYHIREAGSTAVQELAFTICNGIEYVESCLRTGMKIDDFAPQLSFFFNSHSDFFEEIAKFRAARRLWARLMKDRFRAKNKRSWMCRFHTQTAGCSLTAQQPQNNVVRTTLQALAAILGGTNSLHTNAMDEALALPTKDTARLALRTQQILAHESGVPNVVDPLGGSYFLETLTNKLETDAQRYIKQIDSMGGMLVAIEKGFPQSEIQEASYRHQKRVEKGQNVIVGVNRFREPYKSSESLLQIDSTVQKHQSLCLRNLRGERHNRAVTRALKELRAAALTKKNLMHFLITAVEEYATVGEMCDTLKEVFGIYQEPRFN